MNSQINIAKTCGVAQIDNLLQEMLLGGGAAVFPQNGKYNTVHELYRNGPKLVPGLRESLTAKGRQERGLAQRRIHF